MGSWSVLSVPHASQEPIGPVVTVALISAGQHADTLAGHQDDVSQLTGAPAGPRQCGRHHPGGEGDQQRGDQAGPARDALLREERLHEAGGQHDRVDHSNICFTIS